MCLKWGVLIMKKHVILFVVIGVLCIAAVIVGVLACWRVFQNNKIFSAEDVGINNLMNEKIVSARYDSLDPNYQYECEDLVEITSLLETLRDAEFHISSKPNHAVQSLELVYIETKNNSYIAGFLEGVFVFTVNGQHNYYTCNTRNDFMNKLIQIQER